MLDEIFDFDEIKEKLEILKEKFEEIDWSGKTKYFLFSVILIGLLCGSAYASYTSYKVFKPIFFGLDFEELPLTIQSVSFSYDPLTERYTEVNITIANLDNQNFENLKVSVILMNSTNSVIAQGEAIISLDASQTKIIAVTLSLSILFVRFNINKPADVE